MTCPADPVLNAESGSPSGHPLPGPGLGDYLIPLLHALSEQTAAINRLAQSNEMLVQAMDEGGADPDDGPPATYLDGSRVR